MENRLRLLVVVLVVFLTTFLSIGFSAFQDNLVVKDVSATVRLRNNIRITSIASQGGNSNNEINKDGYTDYDEYDVDNIESKIVLPSKYSTITYTIEITNFGDYEMALTEIGDLPNDLEFKNIDYTYGTKLCEGNRCNHGSVNTIHFTVGYKDSVHRDSEMRLLYI